MKNAAETATAPTAAPSEAARTAHAPEPGPAETPGIFDRTRALLGEDAMEALAQSRVAVFGLGGVGGAAAEALARSGVGALDLVDADVVDTTNLNRQVVATLDTVGQPKAEAMATRIARINPACRVRAIRCFYLPETAASFDFTQYSYVVDAVDTLAAKLQLAEAAHAAGVPIISSMGTANKLDPCAFRVADIYETRVCPLARTMRKECRKRDIGRLKVVYSEEEPRQPGAGTSASVAFVPPVAGLILAGEVVKDLARER